MTRKAPPEIKDWAEWYFARLITAEEAVKHVQSGDRVVIPIGGEPRLLPKALFARREELRNVEIFTVAPPTDFGWFNPETRGSFNVIVANFIGRTATEAVRSGRVDFSPPPFSFSFKAMDERPAEEAPPDVVMCTVSPPDPHGYCSFGIAMWNKKGYIQRGKLVLAEVDGRLGRTFVRQPHPRQRDRLVRGAHPRRRTTPGARAIRGARGAPPAHRRGGQHSAKLRSHSDPQGLQAVLPRIQDTVPTRDRRRHGQHSLYVGTSWDFRRRPGWWLLHSRQSH